VVLVENEETAAVEGYGVFRRDRILALYADSTEKAHALMQKILRSLKNDKITLCTVHECWSIEEKQSTVCKRIHRRHTRTVPGGIKWDRVYVVNVGLNLI
ncbi:unnamed protein product, partial [Gongylonema pulchrum]|uniref:Pyr_redox_2 domain-containing protein n=1 Tax=Gongylonema pulchrum TaxID=637853 RepID=A0A183E885_9BILA